MIVTGDEGGEVRPFYSQLTLTRKIESHLIFLKTGPSPDVRIPQQWVEQQGPAQFPAEVEGPSQVDNSSALNEPRVSLAIAVPHCEAHVGHSPCRRSCRWMDCRVAGCGVASRVAELPAELPEELPDELLEELLEELLKELPDLLPAVVLAS